jgi:hypothetical protein
LHLNKILQVGRVSATDCIELMQKLASDSRSLRRKVEHVIATRIAAVEYAYVWPDTGIPVHDCELVH